MKRASFLVALLATLSACTGGGVLQPDARDDVLLESAAAPAAASMAVEKSAYHALLSFVQTVEPGTTRATPGGVVHGDDLVNEFAMVGDMVGTWFFQGKYKVNLKNGLGGSIAMPGLGIFTIEGLGTGTFACTNHFRIENYPTGDFLQYGVISGCHGGGAFEGMKMKGWMTNENDPGLFAESTYDLWVEIW